MFISTAGVVYMFGAITGTDGSSDRISAGNAGMFLADSIADIETVSIGSDAIAGIGKLSDDKDTLQGADITVRNLTVGARARFVAGAAEADSISIGSGAAAGFGSEIDTKDEQVVFKSDIVVSKLTLSNGKENAKTVLQAGSVRSAMMMI